VVDQRRHVWACWRRLPGFWGTVDQLRHACPVAKFAQFIRICRWLRLIYEDRLAPRENAPFSTLWARKQSRVAHRFRQY
jgi:hypothetical protein